MDVLPTDLYGLAGVTIFVLGSVATAWIGQRGHRQDKDSEEVQNSLQHTANLAPAVAAMQSQIDDLTKTVASMESVVEHKYPLSLDTIRRFRDQFPDSGVWIPELIWPDLKDREKKDQ